MPASSRAKTGLPFVGGLGHAMRWNPILSMPFFWGGACRGPIGSHLSRLCRVATGAVSGITWAQTGPPKGSFPEPAWNLAGSQQYPCGTAPGSPGICSE